MPGLRQHHSKWKVPIRHGAEQNAYIETKKDRDFERNEDSFVCDELENYNPRLV
ncbi:uncharacterized protein PHALS_10174 [Plasmopara halstedii]|uniref:Uncharacterized protein n=1 Tax=Plasmopara halstedii TaxID=4781 RepID=A0A0P1AHL3_PLAHL|nr:uncharacterized protein PHALS_10174 [Plasmopara halstedii]CEG39949.1 hypothetical protein PHALS_10174 [Plasmopara halstedii]|eukprot:XP_024576318.1 hypothetical protein PHALS_10174 [Plasmopara halstedii]